MKNSILLVALVMGLLGCASIHRKTSDMYLSQAIIAQDEGDWKLARQYYGRALLNAELGNADARELAPLNYEYGRVLGVLCYYDEAERYLQKALELDQQASGPVHMSFVELACLNYDQAKYIEAVSYYAKAVQVFDELNASVLDPGGVASVLSEYANALSILGRRSEADTIKERFINLQKSNKGKPLTADRTPYATQCE